jgi:hypothetical protein
MRRILGLDAPTRGSATVNGKPYREHAAPLGAGSPAPGWAEVVGRRAGRCSLGMDQRLGIATACSATPPRSSSTRRRTASTPRASVGSGPFGGPGRRRPDGVRLLPPAERAGPDRSPPDRHRPGRAARRHRRGRLRRPGRGGGSGSAAPTRRRWPPGSAPRRWPSPRAPAGPDRVRAEHRPGRPHRRGGRDHPASTIGADQ